MSVALVNLKEKKKKESQAADSTGVIHLNALLLIFQNRLFSWITTNGNSIAGHL